ncbi:DEAD/DEAH box helicase family protein [Patescibacteria group bacterium]|nr:DEAD/DEAH box helicase family protein [Patescibacteria group bacterium]MBU4016682.1 DEAD/DEAH box helicase family protein [Patescibacteria group bacterium]MBU4098203.1 DEAD/DEAH box helicase family protein [Patescibacteria group bacterium]
MLYDEFNSHKNFAGADVFNNKALEKTDILKNLNPAFSIREYQKEALGRFYYYCEEYHQKQKPIHLMFNMATGSGKTLIMAANILYFYQKGYRSFIFFTRLGNIIQKTKANFLDPNSKKYLFADKIVLNGQEIKIKEVDNFEGANDDDINIIFSTTALLHSRFNFAHENVLTYEDFADKKIVLIADEAHNLSAETNNKLSKTEEQDRRNWENTVVRILNANNQKENVLLEFTATARLEQEYPEILEKYKDKAIYRYDLKEYRLDGFSKDVRTLQINAPIMERALSAVIISQYRRKVAEKHKIALKPVILFKANRVSEPKDTSTLLGHNPKVVVSSDFKEKFHHAISSLRREDLEKIASIRETSEHKILEQAFIFFKHQRIGLDDLVKEIKSDFAPEKCLTVDEDKDVEKKQILLNSLEDQNNEIRAIFATEKLNEGWDVLNLFDIVRLYDSRDARANKPGKTTVQEAQLIGRGARYYPFATKEYTDLYRRKFDNQPEEELQILEQLYYHSTHNPDYISELKKALIETGIIAERTKQYAIEIKKEFKENDFWKNGIIFLNLQEKKDVSATKNLYDAKAEFDTNSEGNIYNLPTRTSSQNEIFIDNDELAVSKQIKTEDKIFVETVSIHITRVALARFPDGTFCNLKKIFGKLESISEFIQKQEYLAGIRVKVRGRKEQINDLSQKEKLHLAIFVVGKVLEATRRNKTEYQGSKLFQHRLIREVFTEKKTLRLDAMSQRAQKMRNFDFGEKKWFAQNEIWGTDIEESFMQFMDGVVDKLENKYEEMALLRNEQFFKIYNFSDGEAFAPDFVLFLKEKKTKKEVIYQIFIEPKNETLAKAEPWKEEFLLTIEKEYKTDFDLIKFKNKDFKLLGLPFFNGEVREKFEEVFEKQLLS